MLSQRAVDKFSNCVPANLIFIGVKFDHTFADGKAEARFFSRRLPTFPFFFCVLLFWEHELLPSPLFLLVGFRVLRGQR